MALSTQISPTYYALLSGADGSNFILQHHDDESYLDSKFPLATLIFGEILKIEFKRPR